MKINVQITTALILSVIAANVFSQDFDPQQALRSAVPYLQRRAKFRTILKKTGPAPLVPKEFETPGDWLAVTYPSTKGLELKAWVSVPKDRTKEPFEAVVYFHGNFALHNYDFNKVKPFVDANYVVMLPTLRGENRNPGNCEMFLGEVEDAMNAVRWLARKNFVNRKRIHAFGHSAGGVTSAMLSLHDNIPLRHSGSSGGLYGTDLFDMIANKVPFDLKNPTEREMRVLPGNIRWMKRPHVAFVGNEDIGLFRGVSAAGKELAGIRNPKLKIVRHAGDHNGALPSAIDQYIQIMKADS